MKSFATDLKNAKSQTYSSFFHSKNKQTWPVILRQFLLPTERILRGSAKRGGISCFFLDYNDANIQIEPIAPDIPPRTENDGTLEEEQLMNPNLTKERKMPRKTNLLEHGGGGRSRRG